jgi:glucosamine-phosphate N-acetyltransferase
MPEKNGTAPVDEETSSLISPAVVSALPEGYTIRPLQRDDFDRGFLDVLRVLTTVGDISKSEFEARCDEMKAEPSGYHVIVILNGEDKVVGTGALIVERKLYVTHITDHRLRVRRLSTNEDDSIHHLGLVGHIEDIAVAADQQGKKLGLRLIQALDYLSEKKGCYKTILDCSESNEGFYVKCGFKRAGLEMAHYYNRG